MTLLNVMHFYNPVTSLTNADRIHGRGLCPFLFLKPILSDFTYSIFAFLYFKLM